MHVKMPDTLKICDVHANLFKITDDQQPTIVQNMDSDHSAYSSPCL